MRTAAAALLLFLVGSDIAYALTCVQGSGYKVSDGKVWYSGAELAGIDAATFRQFVPQGPMGPCTAGYAADSHAVVYEGQRVKSADAATFLVIGANYFGRTVYARDRYRIYGEGVEISRAVESFQLLGLGYATDGTKAFYGQKILPGAGLKIVGIYAKSTAAVFMDGEPLEGLDPQTFESQSRFGSDAKKVVWNGRVIEGAEAASFTVIATAVDYAKDRFRVYYRRSNEWRIDALPGADPSTIEQIGSYYFRDARAVYADGKEIVGADPSTYRLTKFQRYGVDKHRVYRGLSTVPGRDPATFDELQHPYSKDKNGVYYEDKPMVDADPMSFQARAEWHARDKNFDYYKDKPVCIRGGWSRDQLKPCPDDK
jgi:hypothetical protein